VLLVLVLIGLAAPAAAQRPRCGFGEGLEALRMADQALAAALARQPPAAGLLAGREALQDAADRLRAAEARLAGCGCPRAAADAGDAATAAEQGQGEAGVPRQAAAMDRARFSIRLARERLDRAGCA
jgi:hypothetical protein